jgi:transposase
VAARFNLPPYTPDLSPIEQAYSKQKTRFTQRKCPQPRRGRSRHRYADENHDVDPMLVHL